MAAVRVLMTAAFCAVLAISLEASGQTAIPDSPAGKQLARFVAAINTGKADQIRPYFAENFAGSLLKDFPAEQRGNYFAVRFRDTRGWEVRSIEAVNPLEVTATLHSKLTEGWNKLRLKVEETPPHKVVEEEMRRSEPPSAPGKKKPLTESEIVSRLKAYTEKLAAADVFSGTVLVAKEGKVLWKQAHGMAHQGFRVPNRVDTKFNLGSMNKMFTAVAIAQLVQQGKLSYQDAIGKHLTAYPNSDVAQKVTIHHLLTHTSGIGDYFNEMFMEASRDRFRQIRDYLPLFQDKALEFEPGSRFRYSNAGFMLLGAIVEKVSGQNYFDYIREQIYKPAGMVNSDAYDLDKDVPNLAFGYTWGQGPESASLQRRKNNLFLHVIKGGPAGGGYSTVEDLLAFAESLRKLKAANPSVFDLVTTGKVEAWGPGDRYAYGFGDMRVNGKRVIGHGGGFPGINSNLDIFLDNGYTVAVMSNYDPPAAQYIADRARDLITRG